MGYLLDTNIVSDFVRYRQGDVARRMRERGEADVLTSIVIAPELRFGAAKRGVARLARRIDEVLARFTVLPLDEPADRVCAELRTRPERQGQPLGANDLLIGATALAGGHTWRPPIKLSSASSNSPAKTGSMRPGVPTRKGESIRPKVALMRRPSPGFDHRGRD